MATPEIKAGATYKFTVQSAEEAVQTIRDRLGPKAKVLSVRQVAAQGLGGIFRRPKLEVIAQVEAEDTVPPAEDTPSAIPVAEAVRAPNELDRATELARVGELRPGFSPRRDALPKLPELLRRSGFSETILRRLEGASVLSTDDPRPLHHALVEVGQHLRKQVSARKPRPLPARSAFLGTPGVGRTTALCKWLAREVFTAGRKGRVLKAEFDRPNPAEGLGVFCEALGLSLEYFAPEAEGSPATFGGPEGEFLYADLPGLSLQSPAANTAMLKFLDREKFTGRVLVLNAAYEGSLQRRSYAAGRDLGATHVVFTHLDEVDHWGRLWDFLLEGELTPLFLATGPSLTGDCEEDAVSAVLRRTIPGA